MPLALQAGGLMLTQSMSSMSDAQHCAKMQVLQTLLRRWHSLADKVDWGAGGCATNL